MYQEMSGTGRPESDDFQTHKEFGQLCVLTSLKCLEKEWITNISNIMLTVPPEITFLNSVLCVFAVFETVELIWDPTSALLKQFFIYMANRKKGREEIQ